MPHERRSRLLAFVDANGLALGVVALLALVVLAALRVELVQDSWLALVAGREVAQHGLPHHDTLFLWTHGRSWIDQQWLAQLWFYGLFVAGGLRLVLFVNAVVAVGAAALAVWFARVRGVSARAVFLAAFLLPVIAPWAFQVRAQTLAEVLFVLCFGLLVRERFGWRAAAGVLALLVLWANVHGSVVLGAALAMLRGLTLLRRARRVGLALLVVSPACVLASPYGLALVGYYHSLLANPLLSHFVAEWKPSTPSTTTIPFYVLLVGGTALCWRYRGRLSWFDKLAFAFLAANAVSALRSVIWFALAALILLAPLVDDALGTTHMLSGRTAARLGAAASGLALVGAGIAFARPATWFVQNWPSAAAASVAATHGRVFADDRYADWLLWEQPALRGRIAYDVRFELLDRRRLTHLAEHRMRAAQGFRLFVYAHGRACPAPRCRVLYADGRITVARSR